MGWLSNRATEAGDRARERVEIAELRAVISELRSDLDRASRLSAESDASRSRRLRKLAFRVTVVSLALGLVCSAGVVWLFHTPATDFDSKSTAVLYLDHMPIKEQPLVQSNQYDDMRSYSLYLPQELAGTPWKLELTGDARLAGSPSVYTGVITRHTSGTAKTPLSSFLYPAGCGTAYQNVNLDYTERVAGAPVKTPYSGKPPFRVEHMPLIDLVYVNGVQAPSRHTTTECQSMYIDDGYDVQHSSISIDGQSEQRLVWAGQRSVAVILKASYAEPLGNAGLIIAGVFFAFTAGFVPLWLDNRRSRGWLRKTTHGRWGTPRSLG